MTHRERAALLTCVERFCAARDCENCPTKAGGKNRCDEIGDWDRLTDRELLIFTSSDWTYNAIQVCADKVLAEREKETDAPGVPVCKMVETTAPEHDPVNHPKHYCREGGMESIDEMELVFGREAVMTFCLLNCWKYRYRAADKNGEEDLRKSDWYMNKYAELKRKGECE